MILDALLGIGVEPDLHARSLHQDDMVHEVADDEERLAARINHKAGIDPPPLKWSDLRYVFDIQEDCNGKEAIQA